MLFQIVCQVYYTLYGYNNNYNPSDNNNTLLYDNNCFDGIRLVCKVVLWTYDNYHQDDKNNKSELILMNLIVKSDSNWQVENNNSYVYYEGNGIIDADNKGEYSNKNQRVNSNQRVLNMNNDNDMNEF